MVRNFICSSDRQKTPLVSIGVMEHRRRGRTDTSAICVSVCVPVAGKRGATDRGVWREGKKKEEKKGKKKKPATCGSLGGNHGSSHVYFCGEQTTRKIRGCNGIINFTVSLLQRVSVSPRMHGSFPAIALQGRTGARYAPTPPAAAAPHNSLQLAAGRQPGRKFAKF